MRHFRAAISSVAFLFIASVAYADQVTTDYDHKAGFSKYHTFS